MNFLIVLKYLLIMFLDEDNSDPFILNEYSSREVKIQKKLKVNSENPHWY